MNIKTAIIENKKCLRAYNTDMLSYTDFISKYDTNTKLYILVERRSVERVLSFNKLLKAHRSYARFSDWNDLEGVLNYTEFEFVEVPLAVPMTRYTSDGSIIIPEDVSNGCNYKTITPRVSSSTEPSGIVAGYGDITNSLRDDKYSSWMCPDVVISKGNTKLDLSSSVPFCNGVACLPKMRNEDLYALGGSKYMKEDRDWVDRNVTVVDFSPLGDTTIIPFSECSIVNKSVYPKNYFEVSIPEDIMDKTTILVILGRMIYPHQLSRVNKNTFGVDLDLLGFKTYVVENKLKSGDNTFNTYDYTCDNIDDVVSTIGMSDDTDNFAIAIGGDVKFCEYMNMFDLLTQGHNFRLYTDGFLINQHTRSLRTHVTNKYDRSKLLTMTPELKYYMVTQDNIENIHRGVSASTVQRMECPTEEHHDKDVFNSSLESKYSLITISKGVKVNVG